MRRKIGRPCLAAGLALFATLAAATEAPADVLEIYPDGTVVRHGGPQADPGRPPLPTGLAAELASAARRFDLEPALLAAVAWQESRFRPEALSPKGALGVMQLTAAAASDLGIDRYDLSQNVVGGAAYLRWMLDWFKGDLTLALAAYNAGPGAVTRHRGVPPYAETRAYVAAVLAEAARRRRLPNPFEGADL